MTPPKWNRSKMHSRVKGTGNKTMTYCEHKSQEASGTRTQVSNIAAEVTQQTRKRIQNIYTTFSFQERVFQTTSNTNGQKKLTMKSHSNVTLSTAVLNP